MFEDIEENVGLAIKAKFFEVFGFYPILDVSETWDIYDEDDLGTPPTRLRDYSALLDTERLDKIDDFSIGYVTRLFEDVIKHKLYKPDADSLDTTASKKYCFSDTEDWWEPMVVSEVPEGRVRYTLIVEIP